MEEYLKTIHSESFYRTVVDSPEWKLWEKHNEQLKKGNGDLFTVFAVWDSTEIDRISPKHFKAFLEFVKTLSDKQ